MIVVDTNIIAYLILPGAGSDDAARVLRRDPEWVAPLLWRSEFQNVIALYLHQNKMSLDVALLYMAEAEELMRGNEYQVDSPSVLALTAQSPCSAYDCEFVALAKELKIPLITSDKQVLKAFPQIAVSMGEFLSQPAK